jgi:membrane-associated protein
MDHIIDILLHLDKHLEGYAHQYGVWIYLILFLIVFCETGLVVTPFLPGDSLLFAVGALSASGVLDIRIAVPLFIIASLLGDNSNYWIGRWIGPKAFHFPKSRIFNPEHLKTAHAFYEKYGPRAMCVSRFLPLIRTFCPFAAGVAAMDYRRYVIFDTIGALLWGSSLTMLGYFFGNIPVVKNNFSIAIVAVIFISFIPVFIELGRSYLAKHAANRKA